MSNHQNDVFNEHQEEIKEEKNNIGDRLNFWRDLLEQNKAIKLKSIFPQTEDCTECGSDRFGRCLNSCVRCQ